MLNPIPFSSHEDIFYSLRCSDSKCSASLESNSQEGWQEAVTSALQRNIQSQSSSSTNWSLPGVHSSFLSQSWACPCPSHRTCLCLCVTAQSPWLLFPPAAENRTFILSNFLVHHKLPQDAEGSFSTQRNVPVPLLPWEWSQQGGKECHATSSMGTNTFWSWNQLKKSEMPEREKIQ